MVLVIRRGKPWKGRNSRNSPLNSPHLGSGPSLLHGRLGGEKVSPMSLSQPNPNEEQSARPRPWLRIVIAESPPLRVLSCLRPYLDLPAKSWPIFISKRIDPACHAKPAICDARRDARPTPGPRWPKTRDRGPPSQPLEDRIPTFIRP